MSSRHSVTAATRPTAKMNGSNAQMCERLAELKARIEAEEAAVQMIADAAYDDAMNRGY